MTYKNELYSQKTAELFEETNGHHENYITERFFKENDTHKNMITDVSPNSTKYALLMVLISRKSPPLTTWRFTHEQYNLRIRGFGGLT